MTEKCPYCGKSLSDKDKTLEHIIPKELGGGFLPDDIFKITVCKNCNNILGRFVDATIVNNYLIHAYRKTDLKFLLTLDKDSHKKLYSFFRKYCREENFILELYLWNIETKSFLSLLRCYSTEKYSEYDDYIVGGNPIDRKSRPSTIFLILNSSVSGKDINLSSLRKLEKIFKIKEIIPLNGKLEIKKETLQLSKKVENFIDLIKNLKEEEINQNIQFLNRHFNEIKGSVFINLMIPFRWLSKVSLGLIMNIYETVDALEIEFFRKILWEKDPKNIEKLLNRKPLTMEYHFFPLVTKLYTLLGININPFFIEDLSFIKRIKDFLFQFYQNDKSYKHIFLFINKEGTLYLLFSLFKPEFWFLSKLGSFSNLKGNLKKFKNGFYIIYNAESRKIEKIDEFTFKFLINFLFLKI